jgi:asparagine synthase (glutamine-hydrolysing)
MCGINGFFQNNNKVLSPINNDLIIRMNDSLYHRGPDSQGFHNDSWFSIGMRRLAIIDVESGNQPFHRPDLNLTIVFNGEIYNYKELKSELLINGFEFKSNSDTEVILVGYFAFGAEILNKLIGMFAFSIYDFSKKKVFIARDKAGEKPLHYYYDQDRFIFSSEIKGILSTGFVKKSISIPALNQYLQLTYIPSPLTIYDNIYKLPPGSYMEFDISFSKPTITKYWKYTQSKETNKEINEISNKLHDLFKKVINRNMISDFPVGIFLSGGLDSSIVTSMAATQSKSILHTFTIGFYEKEFDESKPAYAVSQKYNTNHHLIRISQKDFISQVDEIINLLDEPFADSSIIPTYIVSKFAQKYVKCVLTGDGGDELFGGYNKYKIIEYSEKISRFPFFLRKFMMIIIQILPFSTRFKNKVRRTINASYLPIEERRFYTLKLGIDDNLLEKVLDPNYKSKNHLDFLSRLYKFSSNTNNDLSNALELDFNLVLEGDMLAKVDRASMLNSLETRSPFLDSELVDFSISIDSELKINQGIKKFILRKTFEKYLPPEVLNGSKKGFSIPLSKWIKKDLNRKIITLLLNESFINKQGIFSFKKIRQIWKMNQIGFRDYSNELWVLYVFQKWYIKSFN